MKGNNDHKADDGSVSKDKSCKLGTTFVESNAFEEYVADKNYDPEWMEMDGDYKTTVITELKWTYLDEPPSKEGMHGYDGPSPCLKYFTSNFFNDSFEACAVAGGLDSDLILHLTFNSNQYARCKISESGQFVEWNGKIYL